MSYRGLFIAFACLAIGLAAFALAPLQAAPMLVVAIAGGWIGGAVCARDYYRHIKQFEREREEFNRTLKDRG